MRKLTILGAFVAIVAMVATGGPAGARVAPKIGYLNCTAPDGIQLVKAANVTSFSGAGDTITYTYTITNTGCDTLTTTLQDPMSGLGPISCSNSTGPSTGTVNIGWIFAGATVTCTAQYVTTSADQANGYVKNTGTATGTYYSATYTSSSQVVVPLANGPFVCTNPTYFLAQFPDGGNGTQMWYSLGTPSAPGAFALDPNSTWPDGYNAIGYDPAGPGANYIYGIDSVNNDLVQISAGGTVINHQPMPSLPGFSSPVVGTFDSSGDYWVSEGGGGNTIWEFSINNSDQATLINTISITNPDGSPGVFLPNDFAFSDGSLWGLDGNGNIDQLTLPTGTATTAVVQSYSLGDYGIATDPGSYGGAWTFGNGDLGFSNNNTGDIFQINVGSSSSPNFTLVDQYQGPSQAFLNDGTACGTSVTNMEAQLAGPTKVATSSKVTVYTTVTDKGPANSSGFVVKDTATAGFTHIEVLNPGCTLNSKTRMVECVRGVLDNQDQFTLGLTGTAPATVGKCFTNKATVTGNESDPDPKNNTATLKTCTSTWTSSPGGSITAKSGTVTLDDNKTGTKITCKSSTASGTLKSGSGLAGAGLGSVKALSLAGCTGPLGLTFSETSSALPWALNAVSYQGGVTSGTFTGIDATLSGPSCTATLDGTAADADNGQVDLTYTNSSGKLAVLGTGSNLTVYNVKGCAGLISSGDPVTVSGTYTIAPKQTITEP